MKIFFTFLFGLFLSLLAWSASAQDKHTVSGYVKDAADGEGLIGVSVYSRESGTGAVTNNYGFYSVTLPAGTYTFVISYVGYQKQNRAVTIADKDVRLDLELAEEGRDLQELVVSDRKSTRLNSSHLDLSRMPSSA